jgi:hypothetical protein
VFVGFRGKFDLVDYGLRPNPPYNDNEYATKIDECSLALYFISAMIVAK